MVPQRFQSPRLYPLRLARPDDIYRMSVVAASSFIYAPLFEHTRPNHKDYPSDTIQYYSAQFAKFIQDPHFVVIVALDTYDLDERSKSIAVIPEDTRPRRFAAGNEVIVGVTVWKLKSDSARVGEFYDSTAICPAVLEKKLRDEDSEYLQRVIATLPDIEIEKFAEHIMLERICVHPAYWRKGHGKAMINWGIQLSEMDGVKLGVMTSRGGEELYRSVGFKWLGEVSVERDIKQAGKSQAEDGIRFSLMEYTA